MENPFEVPIGDDLSFFIKTQGTKLIFNGLTIVVRNIHRKQVEAGEIDPYSIDITTANNNRMETHKTDSIFTHYCKVPDRSDLDDHTRKDEKCTLGEVRCAAVFIKKVYCKADENEAFKDPTSFESSVHNDLKQKSATPWLAKKPIHMCTYDVLRDSWQCDCNGGLTHWDVMDSVISSSNAITACKNNNFRVILKCDYDPHNFIPWRNDVGELVFQPLTNEELRNGTGNCIDTCVQLGTIRMPNFCDIPGLYADLLVLSIGDIYFCPSSHPTQGPHICHMMDCDNVKYNGCTVCALTGVAMRDKNGDWCFDKRMFKVSSTDIREAKDTQDCYNYVYGLMTKHNGGVLRDELNDMESEAFSSTMRDIKTIEQLNKYQNNTRNVSAQRSMNEKKKRTLIRDALMRLGTEESKRMAITGHFSDHQEYEREAYITVMKILQFGERSTRAMLIHMEKSYNVYQNIGSTTAPSQIGYRQKKVTLAIEGKRDISRKRITTEDRLRIEHNPEKKKCGMLIQYSGYNGSSAMIMTGKTGGDEDIFEEEVVEIDESDVTKNKDSMITRLAQAALRFWALIRVRTEMGRDYPNNFNFYTFIYAFLYLVRDGYELNTGIAGTGDRVIFFQKDMFLRHALPPDMSDLRSLGYSNNVKRDVKFVYQNIKQAIHAEVVENHKSHLDLDPCVNKVLDFSIESKEFPPSIFVSLQLKKSG